MKFLMKKLIKKTSATALSILGILSTMPSALCTPGRENETSKNLNPVGHIDPFHAMIIGKYFNSVEDFKNLEMVNKKYRMTMVKYRLNPVEIDSKEVLKFFPSMETCRIENFKVQNFTYIFPKKGIKTLIYFPGSFNTDHFIGVLKLNGVITESKQWTESWEREVEVIGGDPLNGCRLTFVNKDDGKKIIFLFDPCLHGNLGHVDKDGRFSAQGTYLGETPQLFAYNAFLKKCGAMEAMIPVGKEFTIPNYVTSIGEKAFWWWKSLKKVTIPDSVVEIKNGAFAYCENLDNVVIPDSVTSIGNEAFQGCEHLKKITIPNSVTRIGKMAFAGCDELTEVIIPSHIKKIEYGAFNGCKNLTKVAIPDSVISIDSGAFSDCTNLREVTIPDSVKSIGSEAFQGCRNLRKIKIPTSVTNIGLLALYGCQFLRNIEFNGNVYKKRDNFIKAFNDYRASQER